MDFHCLARKDLQALCKMNKIPANRTNVAMAEALSSLNIVRGIEKFCKSTDSSVVESSVESPEKDVVTSPKTSRTGRRKQVTATPVTRRSKRVSSVTVQRVYNTRLSARLSKKEAAELENKDCIEAVKINSYCEVVSDNDLGEVLEDKSVPGCEACDNVRVDSSVPEIEQQDVSLLWKNASKDLDLKDRSATEMKSNVQENLGFQNLEMPLPNNKVALDVPLYQKKDDVGVVLTLSETVAEVIPNEVEAFQVDANKAATLNNERKDAIPKFSPQEKGSVDVGFSYSKNELQRGTSPRGNGENLSAQVSALTDMNDRGPDFSLSETEELSGDNAGVKSSIPDTELQNVPVVGENASKDLDSKDMSGTKMKPEVLENSGKGFRLLEKPIDINMMVLDVTFDEKKDDVGVVPNPNLSETDAEVIPNEVEVFQIEANKAETPINEREDVIPNLSLQEKGCVDVCFSYSKNESQSRSSQREDGEILSAQVTGLTDMNGQGSADVGADSSVPDVVQQSESLKWKNAIEDGDLKDIVAKNLESDLLKMNVEGLKMDAVDVLEETPSHKHMVVVDPLLHKEKDDGVVGLSPLGIGITTEVLANEVNLLPKIIEKAEVETPIQKPKVCEQVFSPQKKGSEDVRVHFSFSEGSDNVELHFYVSEADKDVDAAVTFSSDSNERETLKEHLNMESSEKVDYGEGPYDLMIQPKSEEKVMLECWSSGANNSVDGDNFDSNVKVQEDRCDGAFEFADQLDIKGPIEATNDFCGGVPWVDELGDKDSLAVDTVSNSKTFDSSCCDTEDESYFPEYAISSKQLDSKRESTASNILGSSCTRKLADQPEKSCDISVDCASEIASFHQLVSGEPVTNESRLPVASDISSRCSGIKKLSFDEIQKVSEVKPPSPLKLSGQMWPSSAPPSLQSRRSKIHLKKQPLLLADYPFTQKVLSRSVHSLTPCQFATISNYMPLCSTASVPNSKLESNVSDDKENIEQNEVQVKLPKEKACNSKNAVAVCEIHEAGLHVKSPTRMN